MPKQKLKVGHMDRTKEDEDEEDWLGFKSINGF